MDKTHGCSRVVKRIKDKIYTLDFTDFRGKTIADDLLHRDFTINALSVELEKFFAGGTIENLIIDPYNGRRGLGRKNVRVGKKKKID